MTPKILHWSLAFVLMMPLCVLAQKVDYNSIILPDDANDLTFEEKLVRLAWANNPANQVLKSNVRISKYDVQISKRAWLTQVTANGNLNEYTISPPKGDNNVPLYYPKYNFGATVNLGNFFLQPVKTRRAMEEVSIAEQNINSQKLALRAEVLRKYEDYKGNLELWKMQSAVTDDASNTLNSAKEKFKNGQMTLIDYTYSEDNFNTQKVKEIQSRRLLNISKIDVEEMIGVKLEDVR